MKMLIFATTYVDTPERLKLTRQWVDLHTALNPDCDFLIVDSASPMFPAIGIEVFSFPDNIGHLSRNGPDGPNSKGRDGWGRAFCHGLQAAIDGDYDYVVHIEGDSLFRLKVAPIVERMHREKIKIASVPIGYGHAQRSSWVETGLMFFQVAYLKKSDFIAGYDWPNRSERPTPEVVIRKMLGDDLTMMPWTAERSDKGEITVDNVDQFDWITHCKPEVYDRFVESALC